jgi:ribosomal-protein-serine acetyltransferase
MADFAGGIRGERFMFSLRIDDELELRLLEERHAKVMFAVIDENRAYLREWLPWLDDARSADDTKNFIKGAIEQRARNNGFAAGIWYCGQPVGAIGYHGVDWLNRGTSIGYWLGAAYQGRGLMTKACRTIVEYAFAELGLNRIEIRCAPENKKSCAIPERLGFTREGTSRQAEWLYDHFVDLVVYSMLAHEWPSVRQ